MKKIKIGIDVGGTFTHAVAIDVESFSVIGKACVPTTHTAQQGVAKGVVESMKKLIDKTGIRPEEIILIAHSTTQATNALLEGDVAHVGVLAFGRGLEGRLARQQSMLDDIELAPGKFLPVSFTFFNTNKEITESAIETAMRRMQAEGARVFVASEAFGPDNNQHEKLVLSVAERLGVMATAACDLSQLYGMRVRTRTAIVNASMMPKMIETADMTEQAVRESGINAPLMVMRSDGGIMDVNEMRKRPILTMLSGPAAGVAAALMYARISEGIFVEVGGTSSDISVIKNGMPQVKTAQIGNNRLSVKTIDVRTIGVAGGSVPRIHKNKVHDVGPRSAHIANLSYSAYADNPDFDEIELETICPKKGDPSDYLKICRSDGSYTITPTAASYYLGLVNAVGHGQANLKAVKSAVENVAQRIGMDARELAESILNITSRKVEKVVRGLIREYKLDPGFVVMYGGGGGASAIVPHAAAHMKLKHEIAENAEVISAIGAAMGMIRDTVERSIINPSESDIIRIRQQAYESVISMGARPDSVEVQVEIDNANKKVVAIATGSSDLGTDRKGVLLSDEELLRASAEALKVKPEQLQHYGQTNLLAVVGHERIRKHFFGLVAETIRPALIITRDGVVRRKFDNVVLRNSTVEGVKGVVSELISELRSYGDGGELMPDVFVVVSGKIVDMSGLLELSQILSLVEYDLKGIAPQEPAIVLAVRKK